jgi:tetratricopeptide (TPR) repeat protein
MLSPSQRKEIAISATTFFFAAFAACGRPAAPSPPAGPPAASTRATLKLEAIGPAPCLPPAAPSRIATGPDSAAIPLLRTAEEHFQARRWREAIAAVNQALTTDPHLIEARLLAARAALAVGDSASTEAYLAEILKQDPRNTGAYCLRGELALRDNQGDQAIQSLRLALLAGGEGCGRPECVLAHLALATALEREGYLIAAAEQFGAFLDADETALRSLVQFTGSEEAVGANRDRAFRTLSEIYVRLGDQEKAVAACRRAVAERPQEPSFRIRLGRILLRSGQSDLALEEYARLLRDLPAAYNAVDSELAGDTNATHLQELADLARKRLNEHRDEPAARHLYARLLLLTGQGQAAKEQLVAALGVNAAYGPAAVALAEIQIGERDWDSAAKSIETALRAGIDDAHVYILKGRVHDALDQAEEAEAAWQTAFERNPQSAEPLFMLAESMEHRGQRNKCKDLYSRIIEEVDPRHSEAREKLFLFYLNANQIGKAQEVFAGFAKKGLSGPAVNRCHAMLNLATSQSPEGARRLADYQADLQKVVAEYPRDADTLIALAMSNLAARDYESALLQTSQALSIEPRNLRAREFKATLENKLLNFEEAARVVEDLIKDRPRDLGYQQRLLELAITRADFDRAARLLAALVAREDLADRRGIITSQLLEVLLSSKRFDEAVAAAKQWRDENPTDQTRQDALLVALTRAGRHDEAVGLIGQALADDPTNSRLRSRYIAQLHAAKRYIEAQQQLLRWLASAPDDVDLNGLLVSSFCAAKQWDNAIEVAKTGLELPEHRGAYEALLAQSCLLAGRYDEAIDAYRDILASAQTEIAHRDLVTALIRAQRHAEAEQEVNKVLQAELTKRDNGQSYDGVLVLNMRRFLARIYQLMGRSDQAVQQLELIQALMVSDAEANNDLGYAWADAGIRMDEAKRMIMFAASERPNETAYLDSLGWVYYKLGDLDRAGYYLQLAIKKSDQDDQTMFDHLGDTFYRLDRHDQARQAWERAAALTEPSNDPSPDFEGQVLHQRVRAKLEALRRNEVPSVAPLALPQTSTQPATQPSARGGTTD